MLKSACWITSPRDAGVAVYRYQRSFTTASKPLKKAVLQASAVGVYTAEINGTRVGNAVLAPGWTSYKFRTQVQTYDVTDLLKEGANLLSFGVGQGWAVGCIGYGRDNHYTADHVSLIAALTLTYADGTSTTIATAPDWDVFTTPVLSTDIYMGETVDLTAPIEPVGKAVKDTVKTRLIPQVGEWITEHERIAPIAVFRTPKNELVVDFGQNLTGYVEVKIHAPRGSRIVMHHGEVLDRDGNFYNENYRSAKNENVYVCSGGDDVFKPSYTFQGFRYIRLSEYPYDTADPADFRAIAVHSDMKRTGHFLCGNEKINQLYHNIIWGQKSNYLDIPTDCPQRDERLGWTGDTQVFCRTGAINYDTSRFFRKWMGDVALEQTPEGAVKGVVPAALKNGDTRISAAWGDVACVVPWELYLAYGNRSDLKRSFPVMKKWVEYMHHAGSAEFLWLGGMHYGDWLAMDAGEDSYVGATSNDLIASAFFAYSTSLLIKAGDVLGMDMTEYRTLYGNVRAAFRDYFMENGMPKAEFPYTENTNGHKPVDTVRKGVTQTALTLILHFDLCEDSERPALAAKLVELIRANGNRMTTGFVGTPYLLHALSENGYSDVAYTLLMQEQNPSWLYSVCHGATTMWEHWNSLKEDGSFWSTHMNSFNHYAYGAVFDWIFGVACGIKPVSDRPAYRHIAIAPHPDRCLGFADASIDTACGKVRVHWYYKEDRVAYEIEIPAGATATLTLPGQEPVELTSGSYLF